MSSSNSQQGVAAAPVNAAVTPSPQLPLADRGERMRTLMRTAGMLPVLVLLCIGFGLMTDNFFSVQNLSIITQQASINIVLAAGMTFVILTGGIDLSVGSILATAAMVAILGSKIPDWGLLGVLFALLIGLGLGL